MKRALKTGKILIDISYNCNTFEFLVTFVSLRYLDEALGLHMLIKKGVYIPVKESAGYEGVFF